VPIYNPAFSFGAIHIIYSWILGEEIISPIAKRKTPRYKRLFEPVTASPRTTKPAAATNNPNRNEGIADRLSKNLEINNWKIIIM